jgi:L-iditol 2-dehydrogenase
VSGSITVQIDVQRQAEDMAKMTKHIVRESDGDEPRVFYECTGAQSIAKAACSLPRRAGEVIVIGVGRPVIMICPSCTHHRLR